MSKGNSRNGTFKVAKGGKVLGTGGYGSVVDFDELPPIQSIQYFNEYGKKVSSTVDIKSIVFKVFDGQPTNVTDVLKKMEVSNLKEAITKAIDNVDVEYSPCVREIANNAIVARLKGCATPLLKYGESNNHIVWAVVNSDYLYPVYEMYDGDVNNFLKAYGAKVSSKQVIAIILPILQCLSILHNNRLYHNDIKPGNILYKKINSPPNTNNSSKTEYKFVLADFGLMGTIKNSSLSGTPKYQTPLFNIFYECEQCSDIEASYEQLQQLYLNYLNDLSILHADGCSKSTKDSIANIISRCDQSLQADFETVLVKPGKKRGWTFLDIVETALNGLCTNNASHALQSERQGNVSNSRLNSKCRYIETITEEIMDIIFRKNDLHAMGMTVKDVLKITKKTTKKLDDFVTKMLGGDVRVSFFYAEEAIKEIQQNTNS